MNTSISDIMNNSVTGSSDCTYTVRDLVTVLRGKVLLFVLAYCFSIFLHKMLHRYHYPRIASDMIVGLLLGNIPWGRRTFDEQLSQIVEAVVEFAMLFYAFALGLEMDPRSIWKSPVQHVIIAHTSTLLHLSLLSSTTPFMGYNESIDIGATLAMAVFLSGTNSHVLTRIVTDQKMGKTDTGKLIIGAGVHSDMLTMLLLCLQHVFFPPSAVIPYVIGRISTGFVVIAFLSIQMAIVIHVAPVVVNWVNTANPVGKPFKGAHLVLIVAFMLLVGSISLTPGFNGIFSSFMVAIFLPKQGRISKWAVAKINYLLSLFYPTFFLWMGHRVDLAYLGFNNGAIWGQFFALVAMTSIGKVVGAIVSGAMSGMKWQEAAEIGLLLNTRGHIQIFLGINAMIFHTLTLPTAATIVFIVFLSVIPGPGIVSRIVKRAKKNAPTHRRALRWLDPVEELRCLLCVHGIHHVRSTINFMDISRGNSGILIYLTDMIEQTDKIAATIVKNRGEETVTVTDIEVTNMRNKITQDFQSYLEERGDRITLKRMMALSSFDGMSREICTLAEDLKLSLVILPFHKKWRPDGTLDAGNPGFRYVNRKVLRNAPCSVGILVDRGLGSIENITSARPLNVGIIFIGGEDDREALSYAGCVASHLGVNLTVIRFLLQDDFDIAQRRTANYLKNTAEQEEEMRLDDEAFGTFYDRHIQSGGVTYSEKHLVDSAETYATLRSLEGQYELVIVGRGSRVNSILTVGMSDWQQCPELGPIGDILSGSNSPHGTSVFIIQQHNPKGEVVFVDDELSAL